MDLMVMALVVLFFILSFGLIHFFESLSRSEE